MTTYGRGRSRPILWRWQPDPDNAVEGRIRQVATDGSGDVIAIGYRQVGNVRTSLLVKLHGGTGVPIWRVDGNPGTSGYGVAVDLTGDILTTFYGSNSQFIAKYAGPSGNSRWIASLANANDDGDDFKLSLAADNTFAGIAGRYALSAPSAEAGVQIGRFDAGDGTLVWSERYPAATSAIGSLQGMYGGEALLYAGGQLRRLMGSGDPRWTQEAGTDIPWVVGLLDDTYSAGLFVFGDVDSGNAHHVAEIDQLHPATGNQSVAHAVFRRSAGEQRIGTAQGLRLQFSRRLGIRRDRNAKTNACGKFESLFRRTSVAGGLRQF
jgi:hypothetical protein